MTELKDNEFIKIRVIRDSDIEITLVRVGKTHYDYHIDNYLPFIWKEEDVFTSRTIPLWQWEGLVEHKILFPISWGKLVRLLLQGMDLYDTNSIG